MSVTINVALVRVFNAREYTRDAEGPLPGGES